MRILPGAWLEPTFQELRIRKVLPHIPRGKVLVDVGCDVPQVLIDRLAHRQSKCIGLDIVVESGKKDNVELIQQDIQKKLLVPDKTADVVTLLAVLEHMKHPAEIVQEAYRILKPGGCLLVTVPSAASKPVLELFAKIKLVRSEMIDQHENYFTLETLRRLAEKAGFQDIFVEHWEFGFNSFLKAVK